MPTVTPPKGDDQMEEIRRFRRLSALQKLELLQEMQRFLHIATGPKAKRILEKLRLGEE